MERANEISISYKQNRKEDDVLKISSSYDANRILFNSWDHENIELFETFKIVLLSNDNVVKGISTLSTGGLTGTLVDIRILFSIALKTLSTGIILAHNHPSGKLKPSDSDIRLTQKISKAGDLLDIKVLDHLIICPNNEYFSFADNGLI
ncbi:DNA repair protein [Maribacter algarum]|uniref:DNA repair protein n=1 Tax=Maribacter algarum (ex Zhang et al. 2020) TaxID=2578118 RepID=A0A5S3PTY7_9FLAO|nr:JAB domain-containing protein [Maribacter algarum]TMM58433.1 DNA repair protein [Maribacter algarum]